MVKIYDCSNSVHRPHHRGGGGPVNNDVMRYLMENADAYGCQYVQSPNLADVIVTNDVFTPEALASGKRRVKRMDGIFWHNENTHRNQPLIEAALYADHVIFITDFSMRSYFALYNHPLKEYSVVRHWVDPTVYYNPPRDGNKIMILGASATDWKRPEKRFMSLVRFANMNKDNIRLIVIGATDPFVHIPDNMMCVGYIHDPLHMANVLRQCDGFVNLTYKDAATKTVPQAISCGLPVLYANSGGVSEMVEDYGVGIDEVTRHEFSSFIPQLTEEQLTHGFSKYLIEFLDIKQRLTQFDSKVKFKHMLDGYFKVITAL